MDHRGVALKVLQKRSSLAKAVRSFPVSPADRHSFQFENTYFTAICSGSEAGSYLRLTDLVYRSTLALSVIKNRKKSELLGAGTPFPADGRRLKGGEGVDPD